MIDWMCHSHPITIITKKRAETVGAWVTKEGNILRPIDEGRRFEIHFKSIQAEENYSKTWILL